METIRDKLAQVFRAAELLNENLWLDCIDSSAMSVDEFAEHVERTYGVKVDFFSLDVEVEHVYGFIERYGEGGRQARIFIAKNIGVRWMRLVGTKELCQVVLDKLADFRTDGEDTLQRLVTPIADLDAEENVAVRSEQAAVYLAWELLYPHELRKVDLKKLEANEVQLSELAVQYGIPLSVVEIVLSKPYMEFADKWWEYTLAQRQAAE